MLQFSTLQNIKKRINALFAGDFGDTAPTDGWRSRQKGGIDIVSGIW